MLNITFSDGRKQNMPFRWPCVENNNRCITFTWDTGSASIWEDEWEKLSRYKKMKILNLEESETKRDALLKEGLSSYENL